TDGHTHRRTHTHTHVNIWRRHRTHTHTACKRPGTKSSKLSIFGQGWTCVLFFLHVFLLGFLVEETPCEHGENMQTPHRKAREIARLSTEGLGRTCPPEPTAPHAGIEPMTHKHTQNPKQTQTHSNHTPRHVPDTQSVPRREHTESKMAVSVLVCIPYSICHCQLHSAPLGRSFCLAVALLKDRQLYQSPSQ